VPRHAEVRVNSSAQTYSSRLDSRRRDSLTGGGAEGFLGGGRARPHPTAGPLTSNIRDSRRFVEPTLLTCQQLPADGRRRSSEARLPPCAAMLGARWVGTPTSRPNWKPLVHARGRRRQTTCRRRRATRAAPACRFGHPDRAAPAPVAGVEKALRHHGRCRRLAVATERNDLL